MQLNPCNRFLHIKLMAPSSKPSESALPSVVLLPEEFKKQQEQRYRQAELLGVGSQCTVFTSDDIGSALVVVDVTMMESFVDSNGEEQLFILESHVLGTYQ